MALVSDGAISILRRLKEQGYSDRFQRLIHTTVAEGYSYGRARYVAGEETPCRFVSKPSPDLLPGADVQMTDADLFFPLGFTLSAHDHVLMTHIHGDRITAEEYEVVAGPVRNSLGQRATLKLVPGAPNGGQ